MSARGRGNAGQRGKAVQAKASQQSQAFIMPGSAALEIEKAGAGRGATVRPPPQAVNSSRQHARATTAAAFTSSSVVNPEMESLQPGGLATTVSSPPRTRRSAVEDLLHCLHSEPEVHVHWQCIADFVWHLLTRHVVQCFVDCCWSFQTFSTK
jgi:hypothetical protein